MRDQYHEDLDAITASLIDITRLAGSAINRATQALLDADLQAAESVISGDAAIDDLYNQIEANALDRLATAQLADSPAGQQRVACRGRKRLEHGLGKRPPHLRCALAFGFGQQQLADGIGIERLRHERAHFVRQTPAPPGPS